MNSPARRQSGGAAPEVRITTDPIDPESALATFRSELDHDQGALTSFAGIARRRAGAARVNAVELQQYEGFTARRVRDIAMEAHGRWRIGRMLILHRHGTIKPGEVIVLVAAAAAHRRDAIEALDFVIDHLKTDAPLWKREHRDDGAHWIEPKAGDHGDRARWDKEPARKS